MKTVLQKLNTTGERTFPARNYYNFRLDARSMELNNGRSETIRDDAYTVREIMEKFVIHGQSVESGNGLYQDEVTHESVDLRQVQNLDLVDRDELLHDIKIRQVEAREKLEEYRKKIDAENKARLDEAEKIAAQTREGLEVAKRTEKSDRKEQAKNQPSNEA